MIAAWGSSTFVAGVTSGNLGYALRAGAIAAATAVATYGVGTFAKGLGDAAYLVNAAGRALVGCGSAVASGGKCGPGALAAGVTALAAPAINGNGYVADLVMNSTVGGIASVAGGGKFGNGAVTGAFGYLFSPQAGTEGAYGYLGPPPPGALALFGDVLAGTLAGPLTFLGALFYPSDTGVDPDEIIHRGRIQVQNGRPGQPGDLEESWPWSRTGSEGPPTAAEARAGLDDLRGDLSRSQLRALGQAFDKAERFIEQQAATGGVDAPVSRTFQNSPPVGNYRVDIEVRTGRAFVPPW
jgi:hypothetical protein